jgi:hypothetical protein
MQQSFLLQILLLAQHVSGTTMPFIWSSRVVYSVCCLWYFVLWFSSCWSSAELRVMCPVCRMLAGLLHPTEEGLLWWYYRREVWFSNNTSQQDFGTRKVYCVSNVTFHAESKYAIKIFSSPTVFVQWHFYYWFFGICGIFISDFSIHEQIF